MSRLSISRLKNFNVASISDIHLGHKRNPAQDIIKNLNIAFPDNSETAKLDILFICGDVFDNLLYLPADEVSEIKIWIAGLLRLCKKHNIVLRVLEGTPLHDRKQSALFPLINLIGGIGADVKHVSVLSIEHIDALDIDVLYIPDEWTDSPDKTFEQVIELMQSKGLSQVDFTVMHGSFNYQLPPVVKAPRHNEQQYLSIVREYVFVGHIHTHSVYKQIIAHGSFDRIAHGEEEAKGHIRLSYDSEGVRRIKFVENKTAKVYKTISCMGLDVQEILEKVGAILVTLPTDAHVRIEAEKDNPIFTTFETLIRNFPLVTWSKLPRGEEEEEVNIVKDEDDVFIPITITKDNIVSLIMDRLDTQSVNPELKGRCQELLLEAI